MSSILAKLMWSRRRGARRQHPPGRGPHGPCWLHGTCKGRAWIRGGRRKALKWEGRTALGPVVWERPGLSVSPDRGHDREQKRRSVFTLNRSLRRAASASGSGARTEHAAFHTSSGTWTVPTGHRKASLENTVQGMTPRLPPWTEPREGQRVRCSRRQAGRAQPAAQAPLRTPGLVATAQGPAAQGLSHSQAMPGALSSTGRSSPGRS